MTDEFRAYLKSRVLCLESQLASSQQRERDLLKGIGVLRELVGRLWSVVDAGWEETNNADGLHLESFQSALNDATDLSLSVDKLLDTVRPAGA